MQRPLRTARHALILACSLAAACGRLDFQALDDDVAVDAGIGDAGVFDGAALDGAPSEGGLFDDGGPGDGAVPTDGGDGGATVPALVINDDCPSEATVGSGYTCTATTRAPLAGESLTWSTGASHDCAFLAMDGSSGVVTGTPTILDVGSCVLDLRVVSSLGVEATAPHGVTVSGSGTRQVDVGAWHTCALSTDGAVRCWGYNPYGQLGYDDTSNVGDGTAGRSIADMGDVNVGGPVRQISLGYNQTCALLDRGAVRCWGLNGYGRLGYAHGDDVGAGGAGGTIVDNGDLPLGGSAVQIATNGGAGGCAIMDTGNVRCWGIDHGHDNGDILAGDAIAAAGDVPIGAGPVVQIAAGYGHYCALIADGRVRCWGGNWRGQLGYGDTEDVGNGSPGRSIIEMGDVPIGGRAVQVSTGDMTSCAVLDTGAVRCWGYNVYGQLGYDDTSDVADGTPGRSIIEMGDVPVGGPVRSAWAGEQHTCAVMTTGAVRCWGLGFRGQLGYDDTVNVGDGTPGRSIVEMGDVPLGGTALTVVTTDWDDGSTCAVMTNGAIRCWGRNADGQLGLDHTLDVGGGGPGGSIIGAGDLFPF